MRTLTNALLVCLLTIAIPHTRAASAVFSKDSTHVYILPQNSAALIDIDISAKTCRKLDLSASIKPRIYDLAISNSGFVLCASPGAIWSCDTATGKCIKVCNSPKGIDIHVIAYNPVTGDILAAGPPTKETPANFGWSTFYLAKESHTFDSVRARYGTGIGYPAFAPDGALYFEHEGDLWAGGVTDKEPDIPFRSLIAYRCAPLASPIEQNTSPASTGVNQFALNSRLVYADDSRMGGSGWGSLVRFPRPPSLQQGKGDEMNISSGSPTYDSVAKLFSSIEQINEDPVDYLCASADGHHVFFADPYRSEKISLIEDDGKPDQIEIKGLSDFFKQ